MALIVKLRRDKDYTTFSFRRLRLEREAFRDIVINGVPAGVQGALFSLSNLLIQSSIVKVNNALVPEGTEYAPILNGSAAAGNIEGFIYMAMNAVYQGAITVTSQNIGAKKAYRVRRILYSCLLTVFAVGVITSGLAYLLRKPLLSLYGVKGGVEGSLEALAMEAAMVRFRLIVLVYFLCGFMDVCSGVLRGMGMAIVSTVISLIGACLMRVVWLSTVFPVKPTLEIIFISYPISWLLTTATAFTVIRILLKKMIRAQACEERACEE